MTNPDPGTDEDPDLDEDLALDEDPSLDENPGSNERPGTGGDVGSAGSSDATRGTGSVASGTSVDTTAVRERVLDAHHDLIEAVLARADAVDAELGSPVTDGRRLSAAFERHLEADDLRRRLPAVVRTAVDATGRTMAAEPVAAPPYVAVTSRGPLVRATLDDGRLVVAVVAFDVERAPVRYVRRRSTPAKSLVVTVEE